MNRIIACAFAVLLMLAAPAWAVDIVSSKHLIPAPAPIDEPDGTVTPNGSFNLRDPAAPFHSDKLADAMRLDENGRDMNGEYLNLNHAVYTAYRLAADTGNPDTILVLMPGTWAGAMSMDRFARDLLRLADADGRTGLQVWLLDRRSEQLEDHTGVRWAEENKGAMPVNDLIAGMSDYYRESYEPGSQGRELDGRRFVNIAHEDLRFMAGWGADVALRDWRAVVLAAHRAVGNEVIGDDVATAVVKKTPGRRVFIGGHSLGGGLTVLYASYDFDRDPAREVLGKDDVDGLVLLEGGSAKTRKPTKKSAASYRRDVAKRYQPGAKVYFDLDMLGIKYAPQTMGAVSIMGWAAYNAPNEECVFPMAARPPVVRLPRVTNEAVLGFAMDDDTGAFFIARVSIGNPAGTLGHGGQLRKKTANVPMDPGECPVLTPWRPGHRIMDPDFLYSWMNIGQGPGNYALAHPNGKCAHDDPEVTDVHDFARSLFAGPHDYEEAPGRGTGPNDFPEWFFPPRLSSDSGMAGARIVDRKTGVELFNAGAADRLDMPVISFVGDDSMGEFSAPKLTTADFAPGVLAHAATAGYVLKGYTHLDIPAATRNNQPDLAGYQDYNGCAVYTWRFIQAVEKE